MSDTKFTPGPWRIRINRKDSESECDVSICGDIFVLADLSGPQYEHQRANAHLIAAAPDLYAALYALLKANLSCDDDNIDAADAARAALAKARGEA